MNREDVGAEAHIGSKPEWSDPPAKRPMPRESEMLGVWLLILCIALVAGMALIVLALNSRP